MHVCPQEVMAVLAAVPLLRWLLSQLVWLRARYVRMEPVGDHYFEVRSCRSCAAEIEDRCCDGDGWTRERLGEGY